MNFTDTAVYRYIEATRDAEAATAAVFESFGIVRRTVRSVDLRLATTWAVSRQQSGIVLLYVGNGGDRVCFGIIESERLRNDAGQVAYAVNVGDEHGYGDGGSVELIVLDESMEQK